MITDEFRIKLDNLNRDIRELERCAALRAMYNIPAMGDPDKVARYESYCHLAAMHALYSLLVVQRIAHRGVGSTVVPMRYIEDKLESAYSNLQVGNREFASYLLHQAENELPRLAEYYGLRTDANGFLCR